MSDTPFGDDLAEEAAKFLQGSGLIDHLHREYHKNEKIAYDISEKHGWSPEGLKLQAAHRRKSGFIAGALRAAVGGEFYTDGRGCNLCGHLDPRAYEGPERNTSDDFRNDNSSDSGDCNDL